MEAEQETIHRHASQGSPLAPGQQGAEVEPALRQLQESLVRYQELFDFAPVGYLVTDMQGVIQEANYAAAALLGTRKHFLAGRPILFFIAEADRRAFSVNLFRLGVAGSGQQQWTLRLCPLKGETRYAQVTVAAAPPPGKEHMLRWTFRDITHQRLAEERLRAEKEFTTNLIELAEAAIVVLDRVGRVLRANSYLAALAGHDPGALRGCPLVDLLLPEDQPAFLKALANIALEEGVTHGAFRLHAQQGKVRTIAWSARTLSAESGQSATILLVGNDITELQEAQRRSIEIQRLAAIGEMSAGLAHESRNALQRSVASLGLLAFRVQDQPELMTLVERVLKAQDDLQRLYESVREFAAPIKLQVEHCDLAELWRDAWENLAVARRGREAEICEEIRTCDLDCDVSPLHIRQVFRNLFENALTATDKPLLITIRCTAAEIDGREAVQIAVADNGPGFSAADRDRAFQMFFTTKVRGTGLGLSICKRLVEAHGGRIALGQPEGPGTVILITLPRRRAYETTDPSAADRGR
jgi:two-component system, LuxR family, sensor kinase FixL